jgi:hypothetical protein
LKKEAVNEGLRTLNSSRNFEKVFPVLEKAPEVDALHGFDDIVYPQKASALGECNGI